MRYSRKIWDTVKAAHPEHKLWELGKVIGQMWRELDESEKQVFIDEYDTEKVTALIYCQHSLVFTMILLSRQIQYEKQMKTYHSSPAYLTFMAAKNKAKTSKCIVNKNEYK